jgi:hypothetical protein
MAIDNPLDALNQQFENEDRSSDPILSRLAALASALPLPSPVDKAVGLIVGRLGANRIRRIELLLKVIQEEIRRHEDWLRTIGKQSVPDTQVRYEDWLALVEDGFKRAERTRAKERVERIGKILANSLIATPAPNSDDVEEMMRIAMELTDPDVWFLKELVRVQGGMLDPKGRVDRYQAWNAWPHGSWGMTADGEIDSTFSKLESFGLVTRLAPPNNQNIMADIQNRYSLLKKGLEFVRFVQSA